MRRLSNRVLAELTQFLGPTQGRLQAIRQVFMSSGAKQIGTGSGKR